MTCPKVLGYPLSPCPRGPATLACLSPSLLRATACISPCLPPQVVTLPETSPARSAKVWYPQCALHAQADGWLINTLAFLTRDVLCLCMLVCVTVCCLCQASGFGSPGFLGTGTFWPCLPDPTYLTGELQQYIMMGVVVTFHTCTQWNYDLASIPPQFSPPPTFLPSPLFISLGFS